LVTDFLLSIMFTLVALFASALLCLVRAAPVSDTQSQWFTVEWDDAAYTRMAGTLVIPDIPATNDISVFVWPGLQGDSIALQAAMSSSSSSAQAILQGTQVGLTKSDPIPALSGDVLNFDIRQVDASSNTWTVVIMDNSQDMITQTFTLPQDIPLTRAIFAVQVINAPHDFTVSFQDLVLTSASSAAAEWCAETGSNGYNSNTNGYNITGAVAFGTKCFIKELVLPSTA